MPFVAAATTGKSPVRFGGSSEAIVCYGEDGVPPGGHNHKLPDRTS